MLKDVLVIHGYVIKHLEIQQLETTNVCYLTNSYEQGIWEQRRCVDLAQGLSQGCSEDVIPSGSRGPGRCP